jgi:PII-like signaling protein
MTTETEQILCRFRLSNLIRHRTSPLYEWIVRTARRDGLRGATALKGFVGELVTEGLVTLEAVRIVLTPRTCTI